MNRFTWIKRLFFTVFTLLVTSSVVFAATALHLDKNKVQGGCIACHYRTYLKTGGGSEHCLYCHGNANRRQQVNRNIPRGILPPSAKPVNVELEFKKQYRHPSMDVHGVHAAAEVLPEQDPKAPRHADCADCHNPHFLTTTNKFAGIPGKKSGLGVVAVDVERELCYRCHAESANLPARATNKRAEFLATNKSFHPVEAEGKNLTVVSLLRPYKEKKLADNDISRLSCGDCHASDSASSPKGPHGSIHEHILVENYSVKDMQSESIFAYALCYKCHNRNSILANESFKYHSLHIKGKDQINASGTSCYTCHNSHGSGENRYLIRFNTDIVRPTATGQLKYVEKGVYQFSGECYLNCHGVEHNPKSY
jgi:ribosomal protein L40E